MNKRFLSIIFLSFLFFLAFNFSSASSLFDITFPIPELNNCADQASCRTYCDELANKNACVTFAEKHGFVSKEEGEKVKNLPSTGPGQCQSEASCHAFCENPDHEEECLNFVEKHGLISQEKINFVKKVIKNGGPGGCRSELECRSYCENADNLKACLEFGENNGFMSKEQAQRMRKLPPIGPGGCRGQECRDYCENPDNQEQCLKFAEDNDLMSKQELERARKFIGKPGPGGCRGQQCRAYCEDSDHQEECLKFSEENGFVPKEEIERAKKFINASRDGGPGGCRGRECRAYCEKEENRETCFEFAKKQGLIAPEELKRMEVGKNLSQKVKETGGPGNCRSDEECRNYCSSPNKIEECLAFGVSQGGFSPEEARGMLQEFIEDRDQLEEDFPSFDDQSRLENRSGLEDGNENIAEERESNQSEEKEEPFLGRPESEKREFNRPNGASIPEDKSKFEKKDFRQFPGLENKSQSVTSDQSQAPNFSAGPGGCRGPEECLKYCFDSAHREECARFKQLNIDSKFRTENNDRDDSHNGNDFDNNSDNNNYNDNKDDDGGPSEQLEP